MMNKEKRNETIKRFAKKGLTLGLCAVLTGGIAAGTFEGVNRLTGWNQGTEVNAAVNDKAELTLTKASKKSDSDSADEKETKSEPTAKGYLDVSDIAEEAMPSVVSITTKSIQEVQNYFGMFGGYGGYSYAPQQREVEGSGSGIIIGKNENELLVATNYHVVAGATKLSVCFVDGEIYEGTVKGFDEEKDLAVVALPLEDIDEDTMNEIKVATIGNSDDLKIGNQVVAIGNALGYGQSVTTGIVSAKNRRLDENAQTVRNGEGNGVNMIQTDAAINPGNSGGALLNMDGELVGINSAKMASTDVEGMGYAIAITDVSDILENLMNEEPREKLDDSEHGVLGIVGSTVSQEGVQLYGMPSGVFVSEITEGQAADKAGLKAKSIITKFNGKSVSSIEQLIEYLSYYEPGEEVELTVEVQDGNDYEEKNITVVLSKNTNADTGSSNDEINFDEEEKNKEDGDSGDEAEDWNEEDPEIWDDNGDLEEQLRPFFEFFNQR